MEHQSGKLRTRSQAAPDWTAQDSLILVNEISAVENDCLNTLSSFQKWKIIVQNCNALEVHRNLNQCKRKWDSLLSQYRKIKKQGVRVGFPENFNGDLFKAIDDYVRVKEGRSDTESDCDPGDDDDDDVPDSDPCEEDDEEMDTDLLIDAFADSVSPVSKMKKRKLMPHDEGAKESDPLAKSMKSEKVECQRQCGDAKMMAEESNPADKVEMTISLLQNNAAQMKAILSGELGKGMDYKMGDEEDSSATQTDITRRKGDELITCLGDSAFALDQLCQLLQKK